MRRRRALLLSLSVLLLATVACGRSKTPPAPLPTPTSQRQVIVFKTEPPPPARTRTPSPTRAPRPGATATRSQVVSRTTIITQASTISASLPTDRPPDVNPLTGLKVDDPALLRRLPLMVRIGNDPDARPQVGINEADLVYEEIVEWWVTRFTAIYLSQDPEEIRPIRSARLINLQLTPQYGGALAYAGGSDPVRWELSQIDIVNLDDYFVPQPFFFLPNETWERRQALNAAEARKYLRDNGLERDVGLRGFFFDPDVDWNSLPREAVGEAGEIFIPYPAVESELTWRYDPASGQYLRFTLDGPMRDAAGKQLSADNVILYFAEHESTGIVEDSTGATSVRVFVNGFGTAWVAREGKILKGNWQTDGSQTPQFIFNNFQPIPLRPGRSWIEVVPLGYLITIDGVEHARLSDPAGKPEATPTTPASTESRPTQTAPTSTPEKRDLQ